MEELAGSKDQVRVHHSCRLLLTHIHGCPLLAPKLKRPSVRDPDLPPATSSTSLLSTSLFAVVAQSAALQSAVAAVAHACTDARVQAAYRIEEKLCSCSSFFPRELRYILANGLWADILVGGSTKFLILLGGHGPGWPLERSAVLCQQPSNQLGAPKILQTSN